MTKAYEQPASLAGFKKAPQIDEQNAQHLKQLLSKHKISADEYQVLKEVCGRAPSFTELGVFSAMWSEHCSYKSSRVHLKRFPTTGKDVIQGPGENAGIVRLHGKLGVAFKMESHNHPSYIEPYQGAATGVGGILRDVFCMGARPIANLNCLRFGERSHPRTAYLLEHVVQGIGDYGNCIGIPTVGGNISFDASYNGNCLVNAMTVGLINEDEIFRGYATGVGNLVVYVGSSTGRDGVHGATMASDSFNTAEQGERSAVQVGDPFTEKLLLEATLESLQKGLVVGLQDMGAAGLTSSSFEMASRAESGLYMNLDLVPVRATSMSAYELMLSESQERMLMVVKPSEWPALKEIFERWELAHAVIGVVTNTKRVQATYQGVLEIDLPVDPITEKAPKYERPLRRAAQPAAADLTDQVRAKTNGADFEKLIVAMLKDSGDKTPVFKQYDRHIGRKTVLESTHGGAAALWIQEEATVKAKPYLGVGISTACPERYCAIDARAGGAFAVLKAARMLYTIGAEPLALTDCLNFGNPEQPDVMAQFSDGVDGISDACHALDIPVVSGNVSLYNTTDGKSIHPTPMIGMVGRIDDVRHCRPAYLEKDAYVVLLRQKNQRGSFAGSLAVKTLKLPLAGDLCKIDYQAERSALKAIASLTPQALAIRDIGEGGLALALTKFCLNADLGFAADESLKEFDITDSLAEGALGYLIGFASEQEFDSAKIPLPPSLEFKCLGKAARAFPTIDLSFAKLDKQKAQTAYRGAYQC